MLPFTVADDFCREVSRSYGAKEEFSLQASLCWKLAVYGVGFVGFLFLLFHSSTYISSDVSWCNPRKQVYLFDTGWLQISSDRSTCVVQFRIQFGSIWRSIPNWCKTAPMLLLQQCLRYNPIWSLITSSGSCFGCPPSSLFCVYAVCSLGFCPR